MEVSLGVQLISLNYYVFFYLSNKMKKGNIPNYRNTVPKLNIKS